MKLFADHHAGRTTGAGQLDQAANLGLGYVLDTATWRASEGWGETMGLAPGQIDYLNREAVAFAEKVVEAAFEAAPAIMLADPELCRRARDVKAFEYMEGTTNIQTLNAYRSYTAGVGK
mgnify:CR=1 FL=1